MAYAYKGAGGGGAGGYGGGGAGGGYGGYGYSYDPEAYRKQQEARLKVAQDQQDAVDAAATSEERLVLQRRRYKCRDGFKTVADFRQWPEHCAALEAAPNHLLAVSGGGPQSYFPSANDRVTYDPRVDLARRRPVDPALAAKVSLFQGDICALEVDGIVNAANESLLGGGGIDGAIHSAAGPLLVKECEPLGGCPTGETKMTKGYALPARHVLHTVGPMGRGDQTLRSCYRTVLALVEQHRLRSVAFCCVGTGIFGFPLVRATHIALDETRQWLEKIKAQTEAAAAAGGDEDGAAPSVGEDEGRPYTLDDLDRIVFVTFKDVEMQTYEKLTPAYFPVGEAFPAAVFEPQEGDDKFDNDDRPTYSSYGSLGGGSGGAGGSKGSDGWPF